jgi:tetratricopeptide (TPR) repeat protein
MPTRSPGRPSATPTADPATATARIHALEPEIRIAEALCLQCDYELAIPRWDEILQQLPDYASGYLQRSWAYLGLARKGRVYEAARENTIHALDDIDAAIALGNQGMGDYYLSRYDVYAEWVVLEEMWSDREPLARLALENLQMALALGNSDPYSARSLVFELAGLGDCEAALAEASRLSDLIEPWDPPSAGIHTALASAYLCASDYSKALASIDAAVRIYDSPERRFERALALYGLGRLEEALGELDSQIEARPSFGGFRYYFRALVRYDLGMFDGAREDLEIGSYNTWGRAGMATLVAALFARDEGDFHGAIELLRLTEATLDRSLTPMLARTRAELIALGEVPFEDSPQYSSAATPIPTLAPQGLWERSRGAPPAQPADYAVGVRPFSLGCLDHRAFRFVADSALLIAEVRSLEIVLEARFSPSDEDIDLFVWNPEAAAWTMFPWEGGEIVVGNPARFVTESGELIVAVTISSGSYVTIDVVLPRLEVVLADGSPLILGPQE